jgi:hypothetical protein
VTEEVIEPVKLFQVDGCGCSYAQKIPLIQVGYIFWGHEVSSMAKDGTNRGGRRIRAGDKPHPLADKITKGRAAKILEVPDLPPDSLLEATDLDGGADLFGEDIPAPSDYLSSKQKDGRPLGADALYVETWRWLKERGCEKFVNPRLIEAYA